MEVVIGDAVTFDSVDFSNIGANTGVAAIVITGLDALSIVSFRIALINGDPGFGASVLGDASDS